MRTASIIAPSVSGGASGVAGGAIVLASVFAMSSATGAPTGSPTRESEPSFASLGQRVAARSVPIEGQKALDRTMAKLARAELGHETIRVLQFGDSHIAADYITGTVRTRLQARFGRTSRGFTHIDQPWGFGGRRLRRGDEGWVKDRIVDGGRSGLPFGFSGVSITAIRASARVTYRLEDESHVRLFYQAHPKGAKILAYVDERQIGSIDSASAAPESRAGTFTIPPGPSGRTLKLVAEAPGVRMYGLSFEVDEPGVIYESIGPVGADARVYLELDRASFTEHLVLQEPDLIVLMVGGNDALKIRKGWTTLEKVRRDHESLIDVFKTHLPEADCLIWSPMDSGQKQSGEIVSRSFVREVRDLQRDVAVERGCAFWDLYESMGGSGSTARWYAADMMQADLVHPKLAGARLVGQLFFEAWMELYSAFGQREAGQREAGQREAGQREAGQRVLPL